MSSISESRNRTPNASAISCFDRGDCLSRRQRGGEWAPSENNRRAKYYTLTAAGRKALKSETAQWERLSAAISLVVRPA
jgi:hypothetical protein